MSSPITNRSRDQRSKPRSRVTNPRHEVKSELDSETPKKSSVREVMKKTQQRSSSLSKQDKVRESPQKSQSVDRSMANRRNPQNISIKKSLVDTRRGNVGNKKNPASTSNPSNQTRSQSKIVKASSSPGPASKPAEKISRSPMKGPSGKTNVQIAKSFVQNAKSQNSKKESKKHSSKNNSEKSKSNRSAKNGEEPERPRTSTIRKASPENQKTLQYIEIGEKNTDSKSSAEEDDKVSYEEDFEDYDSDFEDSESDSVSVSESESSESISDEEENVLDSGIDRNSVSGNSNFSNPEVAIKEQSPEAKKISEKSFLRMSDRSFLSNKETPKTSIEKKIIKPSRSFINFASAVEQEQKEKSSNKVIKRASDLLEIITLDVVTWNHVLIPPMKYDTFIRFFGRADTNQVVVQTEIGEDEEIQTDEVDIMNKWTQNPSNDNFGSGGDTFADEAVESIDLTSLFHSQDVKLSSFVQNCSKVILTILNEDYSISSQVQATQRRPELFYSDGYYLLSPLDFLKDVPVLNVYCSSEFCSYVLTIHDGITNVPYTNDDRGVICVWNFLDCRKPEHILLAHSQPTCATFGPIGNNIVIAGMVDGSVLLWDLSDNSQASLVEALSLKAPTYSTAVILGEENHRGCIVAIQALLNYSKTESELLNFAKQDDTKNFHVLTLEDMGIINIWVVIEVLKPDFSGLETDLGLSPGGKLRLVRSSSIFLYDINTLQEVQKLNVRTFDFKLITNDSSRILVTTDVGVVLHVNRQGGSANPRFYYDDLEFSSEVRCIDCSPHNEDLFLVGCSDGSAKLYNLKLVRPVMVFLLAAKGDPLTSIQWSPIHPAMFVVLSTSSSLHLWNLLEDSHHPINSYHFSDSRITSFNFCLGDNQSSSQESLQKTLHMFITRDDGRTEVHIFKRNITENEYSKQLEFMKNL